MDPTGHETLSAITLSFSVANILTSIPISFLEKGIKGIGLLGATPWEEIKGLDYIHASTALFGARAITQNSNCDRALIDYGIESIKEYALKAIVNGNIFDGRKSTIYYPSEGKTAGSFLSRLDPAAITYQKPISPTKDWPILLGAGFFEIADSPANPETDFSGTANIRTLILLHEIVHQGSHHGDKFFGGTQFLSFAVGSKCFPGKKFGSFYPRGSTSTP